MSGFNPFRRHLDGGSTNSKSNLSSALSYDPTQSTPAQLPNGYPRKSALSLELETDDSTTSAEPTADPFNPDLSTSDNDGDDEDHPARSPRSSALDDRPRGSVGSAPLPAPSDGSSTSPLSNMPVSPVEQNMRSTANTGAASMPQDMPSSTRLAGPASSKEQSQSPSASGRSKEKKPPPPPRSHHGKRISATADTVSSTSTTPPRSTSRPSYQASPPEGSTSARSSGTPSTSSILQPPPQEYFSVPPGAPRANDTSDTLSRSNSQQKRPPTPPLSRRHSQMQRSKSTQSKSSGSRLTISSLDSEDSDSSQPSSPSPTYRSATSQDRKRGSMPPPSSGEVAPSTGFTADSSPSSTHTRPPQPGRRAWSHGHIMSSSSSTVPPPPPPPRRARDPNPRNSDGGSASRMTSADEIPPPQPSNAHDILADLSRLQKEVDDLRGHYEERKVRH